MLDKRINREQIVTAMLIKWIDKMFFLNGEEKALLLKISFVLIKDRANLFKLYDEIFQEEEHYLSFNDEKLELSLENKKMIVSTLIDFSDEILPLGSLVTLKNEELKDKEGNDLKIIITKRFLSNEKSGFYFTYSGTIYPIGSFEEEDKLLHFTSESIKEVLHKGFSDDVDVSYTLAVKNELILNRGVLSVFFADVKEKRNFEIEIQR